MMFPNVEDAQSMKGVFPGVLAGRVSEGKVNKHISKKATRE